MAVNTSYTYISPHPYIFFTCHGNRNTNLTVPPQPILTYTLIFSGPPSWSIQRQLYAGLTPSTSNDTHIRSTCIRPVDHEGKSMDGVVV